MPTVRTTVLWMLATSGALLACSSPARIASDAGIDAAAAADAGAADASAMPDAAGDAGSTPSAFRVALSVSPFTMTVLNAGIRFTDGTRTATTRRGLQELYVAHGATEVFARIATERTVAAGVPDDHGLETGLALATMARDMGLPFNPEFGLWGHYGDVACQPPPDFSPYPELVVPGAWETLTVDQMLPVLRAYGALVARAVVDTGANVEIWDVGNEVDFGTAGVAVQPFGSGCPAYRAPDGVDPAIGAQSVLGLLTMASAARVAWLEAHVWPHEARIFAAFMDGVRSVVPTARFATHISQSTDSTFAVAFYRAMRDGGAVFDELGLSFYPTASDSPPSRNAALRDTVAQLRAEFARPIFIAEFGYPASTMTSGPYATWLHASPNYPVDETGQAAELRDLASWGRASGVSGIRPWAPDIVVSGWDFMALFRASGFTATMRPSLDSVAMGIAAPDATALRD